MIVIHVTILLLTVVVIVYADYQGSRYFTGKKSVLSERSVKITHWLVSLGLLGMVTSGLTMAWPLKEYYFAEPVFLLKMFFVAALFINGVVISHLLRFAVETPFKELSPKQKRALVVSGTVSMVSWLGAITIGLFFL